MSSSPAAPRAAAGLIRLAQQQSASRATAQPAPPAAAREPPRRRARAATTASWCARRHARARRGLARAARDHHVDLVASSSTHPIPVSRLEQDARLREIAPVSAEQPGTSCSPRSSRGDAELAVRSAAAAAACLSRRRGCGGHSRRTLARVRQPQPAAVGAAAAGPAISAVRQRGGYRRLGHDELLRGRAHRSPVGHARKVRTVQSHRLSPGRRFSSTELIQSEVTIKIAEDSAAGLGGRSRLPTTPDLARATALSGPYVERAGAGRCPLVHLIGLALAGEGHVDGNAVSWGPRQRPARSRDHRVLSGSSAGSSSVTEMTSPRRPNRRKAMRSRRHERPAQSAAGTDLAEQRSGSAGGGLPDRWRPGSAPAGRQRLR